MRPASDALPVRPAGGLPPASFRSRLATGTLALSYGWNGHPPFGTFTLKHTPMPGAPDDSTARSAGRARTGARSGGVRGDSGDFRQKGPLPGERHLREGQAAIAGVSQAREACDFAISEGFAVAGNQGAVDRVVSPAIGGGLVQGAGNGVDAVGVASGVAAELVAAETEGFGGHRHIIASFRERTREEEQRIE